MIHAVVRPARRSGIDQHMHHETLIYETRTDLSLLDRESLCELANAREPYKINKQWDRIYILNFNKSSVDACARLVAVPRTVQLDAVRTEKNNRSLLRPSTPFPRDVMAVATMQI